MAKSDQKPESKAGKKASDETVAVALGYEHGGEFAPKVLAGGRGAIAEQILQIAFANDIKVREDSDLAQMLSVIDIDSEIPIEAFAAVAEILVYVYQANGDPILNEITDPPQSPPPDAPPDQTPEATP